MNGEKIHLVFRVESKPNRPPIVATLHWHPDDPMAVCLFLGTGKRTRMWLFALDLLTDAIDDPGETVGSGDVRIRVDARDVLWLSLSSPAGHATLTCPSVVAEAFVDAVDRHDDDHAQSVADQLDWALTELLGEENQSW